MALYSRADFERDMLMADRLDALVSRAVAAGKMTGLDAVEFGKHIERARQRLRGKLLWTRTVLSERKTKAPKGDTPREAWREVSDTEARSLENSGRLVQRSFDLRTNTAKVLVKE